jgi:hypothetical protein
MQGMLLMASAGARVLAHVWSRKYQSVAALGLMAAATGYQNMRFQQCRHILQDGCAEANTGSGILNPARQR